MSRTSLTRFLIQEQHAGRINADLRQLIAVVARACTSISIAVSKGALGGVLGDAGTGNVQGEAQKKLDVISNEILLEANAWGGHLAACASEKWTTASRCRTSIRAVISCCCSTLDGSSNIDVNVSVGTIFSVLRCPTNVELPGDDAFLQPGSKQIAAGYHLRAQHPAGADRRPWHPRLHSGPREGRVRADHREHADSGHPGIRHQHVQPASLGSADAGLRQRPAGGQGRRARQELQHALDRQHGGRRASHPDPRGASSSTRGTRRIRPRPASCA